MWMNANHGRTPPPHRPAHTWVDTSPNDDTHYSPRFSSDELNVLSTNELLGTPGGTVQSYREVIDKLRIDNSNLKLKLFFMENVVSETTEKLNGAHHPGLAEKDRENFLHENVELRVQATELERRLGERNSQKGAAERFLEEKELVNSQLRTQTMDMADEIALLRSTLTDVRQDSLERETECHSLRVDMETLMKARDEEVQSLREIVDDVEETYTSEVGSLKQNLETLTAQLQAATVVQKPSSNILLDDQLALMGDCHEAPESSSEVLSPLLTQMHDCWEINLTPKNDDDRHTECDGCGAGKRGSGQPMMLQAYPPPHPRQQGGRRHRADSSGLCSTASSILLPSCAFGSNNRSSLAADLEVLHEVKLLLGQTMSVIRAKPKRGHQPRRDGGVENVRNLMVP
mmetsp:Transcript_16749/g.28272  ORF Transcript_16749/g.28272 Transcript_16749/m.28272 type:complete len:402 (-) Transcript_16749:222-1427(-)|eukprot:CAMPEP_0198205158 /NCGR_PEP_ID=MMETSP1445-20131203/8635_1 /TAXON_ID=36898 /ORGANISM="Pyramimonas sp., Strain CCMP2087" /LENGTH=401 /DNA_ID=CAMNT_0043877321 /DNA_START=266 /DNA_END=1471 /DNA_ORIENTATION=+